MERVIIAAVVVVAAVLLSRIVARRRRQQPPSQPRWLAPVQLDRSDFARPEAPWLVAVFTSSTCTSCAAMVSKATVVASSEVSVDEVEVGARADLHRRYRIEAVPIVVVADASGVVQASFIGPVSATDLWAAVARVRDPAASGTPSCEGHGP